MGKTKVQIQSEKEALLSDFDKMKKKIDNRDNLKSSIQLFDTLEHFLKVVHPISEHYNESFKQYESFKVCIMKTLFQNISIEKYNSLSEFYFQLFENDGLLHCLAAFLCRLWQLHCMFNKAHAPSKYLDNRKILICSQLNRCFNDADLLQMHLNGENAWKIFVESKSESQNVVDNQQLLEDLSLKKYEDTIHLTESDSGYSKTVSTSFRSALMFFETKYNDELSSRLENFVKNQFGHMVECLIDCCVDSVRKNEPIENWFNDQQSQTCTSSGPAGHKKSAVVTVKCDEDFVESLLLYVMMSCSVQNWEDYSADGAFVNYSQISSGSSLGFRYETGTAQKPVSNVRPARHSVVDEDTGGEWSSLVDTDSEDDDFQQRAVSAKRSKLSRSSITKKSSTSKRHKQSHSSASFSELLHPIVESVTTQDSTNTCVSSKSVRVISKVVNVEATRVLQRGSSSWFVNAVLQILYHILPIRAMLEESKTWGTTSVIVLEKRAFLRSVFPRLNLDLNSCRDLWGLLSHRFFNREMRRLKEEENNNCGNAVRQLMNDCFGDTALREWFGGFVARKNKAEKLLNSFQVSCFTMAVRVVGECSLQDLLVPQVLGLNERVIVVGADSQECEFDKIVVAPSILFVQVMRDCGVERDDSSCSLVYEKTLCLKRIIAEPEDEKSYNYKLTGFVALHGMTVGGEYVTVCSDVKSKDSSTPKWHLCKDPCGSTLISEDDALSFTGKLGGFCLERVWDNFENRYNVQFLVYVAEESLSGFYQK